ncbi:MAG TPA: hypothetical protein VEZ20_02455 [Allosphingosinicella sp.]|jgi:hypothetical protein|nr:hypothetical protein [Allosphingosinicella sp.]
MSDRHLSVGEVTKASIVAMLAPLVPAALLLSFVAGPAFPVAFLFGLVIGVPIAAVHVLGLWLPAYLLLRRWRAMGPWQALLLGFASGGTPTFLLSFPVRSSIGSAVFFGLCGLVGGLAFHCSLERERL